MFNWKVNIDPTYQRLHVVFVLRGLPISGVCFDIQTEYIALEAAIVQVPADGGIEPDTGATPDIIVNKL